MVASMFRMVSAQPDPGAVLATWDEVATAMRVIPEHGARRPRMSLHNVLCPAPIGGEASA
jgi:hypothetical protein